MCGSFAAAAAAAVVFAAMAADTAEGAAGGDTAAAVAAAVVAAVAAAAAAAASSASRLLFLVAATASTAAAAAKLYVLLPPFPPLLLTTPHICIGFCPLAGTHMSGLCKFRAAMSGMAQAEVTTAGAAGWPDYSCACTTVPDSGRLEWHGAAAGCPAGTSPVAVAPQPCRVLRQGRLDAVLGWLDSGGACRAPINNLLNAPNRNTEQVMCYV